MTPDARILLPKPEMNDALFRTVLTARRSVRRFSNEPLSLQLLSQLLFAGDGRVFDESGRGCRTAPSAGSCHPVEILVFAHRVEDLEMGIYRYRHERHALQPEKSGDMSVDLMNACLCQPWVRDAAAVLLLTGVYERITHRYGDRSVPYLFLEAGHIAQNILLQAAASGLGAVPVGSFTEESLQELLGLPITLEKVLYVIPVGKPLPKDS